MNPAQIGHESGHATVAKHFGYKAWITPITTNPFKFTALLLDIGHLILSVDGAPSRERDLPFHFIRVALALHVDQFRHLVGKKLDVSR